MPVAVLGTAHLFGATPDAVSRGVVDAAWEVGFRAFDTAPLYGHGSSEVELGGRLSEWSPRPQLTSKVGLEPVAPGSRAVRTAKAVARHLPAAAQRRLRPGGDAAPRGVFDVDLVRWSLDRTLLRLGHVDRLMLHEAHAADVTDELLAALTAFRDRGDIGQLGVATVNSEVGAVVRRAPEVLTAVHIEVGPFAPAADLPASVTTVVGHGVLGPGGSGLHRLSARLDDDGPAAAAWRSVTAGSRWSGESGLADALVARAAALPLADVIVATSRTARLRGLRDLASGTVAMPTAVAAALDELVRSTDVVTPAGSG